MDCVASRVVVIAVKRRGKSGTTRVAGTNGPDLVRGGSQCVQFPGGDLDARSGVHGAGARSRSPGDSPRPKSVIPRSVSEFPFISVRIGYVLLNSPPSSPHPLPREVNVRDVPKRGSCLRRFRSGL